MEDTQPSYLSNLEALAEAILDPQGPKIALLGCDDPAFRETLIDELVRQLPDFQHILLELSPTQVDDLEEVLREKMPAEIMESPDVRFIIHVLNLESSLYYASWQGEESFISRLSSDLQTYEEEFPFVTLLWLQEHGWAQIERKAMDFLRATPYQEVFMEGKGEKAAEPAPETDAEKLLAQAEALVEAGDHHEAMERYALVREKISDASLSPFKTGLLAGVARLAFTLERFEWATELCSEALDEPAADTPQDDLGRAWHVLGLCQLQQGEGAEGLGSIEEAIAYFQESNNPSLLGASHADLGALFQLQGDKAKAVGFFQQAVTYFRQADLREKEATARRQLARLLSQQGKLEATAKQYEKAAGLYHQLQQAGEEAYCWQQAGATWQDQRRWAEALRTYEHSLEAARRQGDDFMEAAMEDSVSLMKEQVEKKGGKKKKGFLGGLFG
jgi:tetratricopeptide (TPR) repeat protein